jgi:hypothetical protein
VFLQGSNVQEVTVQMVLVDSGDLKAISKALRGHADGKRLRKELVAELRQTARPMQAAVKAAWLAAPSRNQPNVGGQDLRKLLARSTRVQVRLTGKEAGVLVRTDGRKMPSGMRALPGHAEGIRRRPWRHPVHGNRGRWVTQRPFPRFYAAVQPDEGRARRAVTAAIDKVYGEIERAHG